MGIAQKAKGIHPKPKSAQEEAEEIAVSFMQDQSVKHDENGPCIPQDVYVCTEQGVTKIFDISPSNEKVASTSQPPVNVRTVPSASSAITSSWARFLPLTNGSSPRTGSAPLKTSSYLSPSPSMSGNNSSQKNYKNYKNYKNQSPPLLRQQKITQIPFAP